MSDEFKIPQLGALAGKDQYQLSKISKLEQSVQGLKNGESTVAAGQEKKASEQFEALLIQQMMSAMWQTVPKGGMLTGGNEEQYYRDMLSEALGETISKGQGMGIKDVILREFQRTEHKKK